jgi:hypothetical protein
MDSIAVGVIGSPHVKGFTRYPPPQEFYFFDLDEVGGLVKHLG